MSELRFEGSQGYVATPDLMPRPQIAQILLHTRNICRSSDCGLLATKSGQKARHVTQMGI